MWYNLIIRMFGEHTLLCNCSGHLLTCPSQLTWLISHISFHEVVAPVYQWRQSCMAKCCVLRNLRDIFILRVEALLYLNLSGEVMHFYLQDHSNCTFLTQIRLTGSMRGKAWVKHDKIQGFYLLPSERVHGFISRLFFVNMWVGLME